MTRPFGDELLKQRPASSGQDDPIAMVNAAMEKDGRRLRRLAAVIVALWAVAVAGIPLSLWAYEARVAPMLRLVLQEMITHQRGMSPAELDSLAGTVLHVTLTLGMVLIGATMGIVLVAATMTVALTFAMRRVTLRQVNANLAEISRQLGQVAPPGRQ